MKREDDFLKEKTCDRCNRFDTSVNWREYPNVDYSEIKERVKYRLCMNCIKEALENKKPLDNSL
jgi:hypothetical protein